MPEQDATITPWEQINFFRSFFQIDGRFYSREEYMGKIQWYVYTFSIDSYALPSGEHWKRTFVPESTNLEAKYQKTLEQ